jgi:putative PIN family toxin of toxin-antitoxin system
MPPLQIVIDTNVLVCALRSRRGPSFRLLSTLGDPRWQASISSALLLEYEEKLLEFRAVLGLTSADINTILDMLTRRCRHRVIYFHWRPSSRDPDDDFLVDLAIGSACDYCVTFNLRDWPVGIPPKAVTPREFLAMLPPLT